MNKRKKIFFVYKEHEEYKTEALWAIQVNKSYKIDNIPFFINSIALDDIIDAEKDENELYFEKLVEESGNSTIQLVILDYKSQAEVGKEFEALNCSWEGSHLPNYISICIPKEVEFKKVKLFLDKGSDANLWDYKEACISTYHTNN